MSPRRKQLTTREKIIGAGWTLAQMGGLAFFAWINATRFDKTELMMLGEFAAYYKLLSVLRSYTE